MRSSGAGSRHRRGARIGSLTLAAVAAARCSGRVGLSFTVEQGLRYGARELQIADLLRPAGECRGVVMLLHGGFWQGTYDRSLMAPIAGDLASRGLAVWNVEYRSLGTSGGYPETFEDVSLALDWLAGDAARERGVGCGPAGHADGPPLAVVGHSAGGHLALWLGLRPLVAAAPGPGPRGGVRPRLVLAQAGVADLQKAYTEQVGGNIVKEFLGTPPASEELRWRAFWASPSGFQEPFRRPTRDAEARWRLTDPAALAGLLEARTVCGGSMPTFGLVHGADDQIVPPSQSASFADAMRQAGAGESVVLQDVEGEQHFEHLEPRSRCWRACLGVLQDALAVDLAPTAA